MVSFNQYAIPKIQIRCNVMCAKVRLRLPCLKLLTAQQLQPHFKTAKVVRHFCLRNGVSGSVFMESTFERTVIKTPLKMDINQKFQLTQFHFDSHRGFLTKSTFEIIIKKLIKIFQNLWFTSVHFSRDLQYHSRSK